VEWLISALLSFVLTLIFGIFALYKLKGFMAQAIGDVADNFIEGLAPTMKKGFSLAGSLGGDAKSVKSIQNKVAKGFINENYGGLKMLAEKMVGIDVDELIEDYGAANVIKAIQGLGLLKSGQGSGQGLLSGLIPSNNPEAPSKNPYG